MYVIMQSIHGYDGGQDNPLWYVDTEEEAKYITDVLFELNNAYAAAWEDFFSENGAQYHDLIENDDERDERVLLANSKKVPRQTIKWALNSVELYRKGLSRQSVVESILDDIGACDQFRDIAMYDEDAFYTYVKLEKFASD